MDLIDHDLSVAERQLAAELAGLTQDPSADRRARILAAVRSAPGPRRQVTRKWRPAIAAAAAVVLLAATSVGVVAASGDALPSSANYPLRSFGERVRLPLPTRQRVSSFALPSRSRTSLKPRRCCG